MVAKILGLDPWFYGVGAALGIIASYRFVSDPTQKAMAVATFAAIGGFAAAKMGCNRKRK